MKKFYVIYSIVYIALLVTLIFIGSNPEYKKQSGTLFGLLLFGFPLGFLSIYKAIKLLFKNRYSIE